MISLIYLTYRPGGMDLLLGSLIKQVSKDYELIIVDDYPGRVERGEVKRIFHQHNIPLTFHTQSKPHSYPTHKVGVTNAMNSGLLCAKGPWVVFLSDFTFYSQGMVSLWEHLFEEAGEDSLISGTGILYSSPKPDKESDLTVWSNPPELTAKFPWVPREFETFFFGSSISTFEKINGMDERADYCTCWNVSSIMKQCHLNGFRFGVANNCVAHMVDHRVWDETPVEGPDSLWRINSQSLLEKEPEWEKVSPNPYDFSEIRRRLLKLS